MTAFKRYLKRKHNVMFSEDYLYLPYTDEKSGVAIEEVVAYPERCIYTIYSVVGTFSYRLERDGSFISL